MDISIHILCPDDGTTIEVQARKSRDGGPVTAMHRSFLRGYDVNSLWNTSLVRLVQSLLDEIAGADGLF